MNISSSPLRHESEMVLHSSDQEMEMNSISSSPLRHESEMVLHSSDQETEMLTDLRGEPHICDDTTRDNEQSLENQTCGLEGRLPATFDLGFDPIHLEVKSRFVLYVRTRASVGGCKHAVSRFHAHAHTQTQTSTVVSQ